VTGPRSVDAGSPQSTSARNPKPDAVRALPIPTPPPPSLSPVPWCPIPQGLADKQAAAQAALDVAVNNQINAIKTATYREIITLTQALALWTRARRDRCGASWGGRGGGLPVWSPGPPVAAGSGQAPRVPEHLSAGVVGPRVSELAALRRLTEDMKYGSNRVMPCEWIAHRRGEGGGFGALAVGCLRRVCVCALARSPARSLGPLSRRALTLKQATLANLPCTSNATADNTFLLENNNTMDTTTSRERNVGLTNRVIAGLLLHQVEAGRGGQRREGAANGGRSVMVGS
jgi:hypothetical protein